MIGVGIGLPFFKSFGGVDAQAQAHFNRVIADGGLVPSGLSGVNAFFNTIKTIYGTSDINTAISVGLDPQVLGYKLGAGSGTTLGQAAQKLYSVKSTENLLTFSEQFDNAAWTKSNLTVTANAAIAPNGTMTAEKIIGTAINATHIALQQVSFPTNTIATCSIYAKAAELSFLYVGGLGRTPSANEGYVFFNLSNGTVGVSDAGYTGSMSNEGNGWYKLTVNAPIMATSTLREFRIGVTNTNGVQSYLGDGTSGVFVWGAQLNTGSVALPYTPTTTTAETLADVVQTTAASQPLLLVHEGANYWFGSGVTGNYCSTPNAAANSNSGNKEFIYKVDFTVNSGAAQDALFCKDNVGGGQRAYCHFYDGSDGKITLNIATDLTAIAAYRSDLVGLNYVGYIKITFSFVAAVLTVSYFKSVDGVSYTACGTNTISGNNLINTGAILELGSRVGSSAKCLGKIYRATISNSIGGAPVIDFNPNSYNAATSQTQWTSSTGEIWSVQTGTATTGYKGVLVDRTIVQSDGVDDKVSTTGITLFNNHTNYCAYKALVQDSSGNRIIYNNGTTNFVNAIVSLTTNTLFISLTNLIFGVAGTKVFQTLGLSTSVFGTNNTKSKINNGSFSTPLIGTYVGGAGISLFGAVTVHFANHSINTMIVSVSDDSATINTAMYNYIRSINNNAF
jgi:hypothetical protein